jgi:amino acid adenylation domain-containing protein
MSLPETGLGSSKKTDFPLTPMQEGILYDAIRDAGTSRYISLLRYRLRNPVNPDNLRRRWELLGRFHPTLRTRFHIDPDGNLKQTFPAPHLPGFSICHLSGLSGPDQERVIRGTFTTAQQRGLNPFVDRLCHLVLFDGNGQTQEMGLIFHHAVLDGWSLSVLFNQLLADRDPQGRPVPFTRYIRFLADRGTESDLAYWKSRLDNVEGHCSLPGTFSQPAGEGGVPGREDAVFQLADSDALVHLSRQLRVSPGRFLQSLWALLLCRYNNGQALFGNIIAGRMGTVPGVTEMVGMCVNTLPVRVTLPEDKPFSKWLREWNDVAATDERHGFISPAQLGKALPRGVDYTDHLFVVDPAPLPDSPIRVAGYGDLAAGFIAGFELGSPITACFSFDPGQYDPAAVKRMGAHFRSALNSVIRDPDILIKDIPLLSTDEIRLLLTTDPPVGDTGETLVSLWQAAANRYPRKPALVFGETRLTYAALSRAVETVASGLAAGGVGPGDRVALKLDRSHRMVIAALAVMRIGGAYLPMAPEWPVLRIQQVLERTAPVLVLDEDAFERLAVDPGSQVDERAELTHMRPTPSDPAYVIMTSGTTGRPKGVVVEHHSGVQFCRWAMDRYQWGPASRSAVQTRFAYDATLWGLYPALFSGGTVHILDEDTRSNLHRIRDYLVRERVTHMDLPVAMAEEFMAQFTRDEAPPSLKFLATGGEALRRYTPGPYRVFNEYGPTECTVSCTAVELVPGMAPIPIGRPMPGMRAHILDPLGRLCPLGVAGELCFSGGQLARGYWGDTALTARKFVPNPFYEAERDGPEHQRLYRTGDLACWQGGDDDLRGNLLFLGRSDQQVKVRGFRVELGEIENALQAHPKIQKAVAGVRAGFAGGEKMLMAWVVCGEADFSETDLRFFLTDKLPSYMLPRIIRVAAVPLTTGGKIDFERLPMPESGGGDLPVVPPATRAEKALLETLTGLLPGCAEDVMQGFLDAGGDSINAIRLATRMERLGWRLSLPEIMSAPSLAALAEKMEEIPGETADGCRPETGDGCDWLKGLPRDAIPQPSQGLREQVAETWGRGATVFAPTVTQKMLLTQSALLGPAAYAVIGHYRLPRHITDPERIRTRLASAVRRHDILRAAFVRDRGGEPWMVIPEHRDAAFDYHDYSSLDAATGTARLNQCREAMKKGLDPYSDALFSITLFRFGEHHLEMLLHYHHLILDGWSLGILFQALFSRKQLEAEAVPTFRAYAQWTHIQRTADPKASAAWWEKRFPANAEPAKLAPWPERRPGAAPDVPQTLALLQAEEFRRCANLARRMRVTPAAFFMALWHLLLEPYTAAAPGKEMLFGFVSAGRPPLAGIENLVGMCAHTLPVSLTSAVNRTFAQLAKDIQERMDAVRSRYDIPIDLPGRLPRHVFSFESLAEGDGELPAPLSIIGKDGYDLVILFQDDGHNPGALLRFDPAALSPDRAEQLRDHWQSMVKTVLDTPEAAAETVAGLPAGETRKLLEQFGRGRHLDIRYPTAVHAFRASAARFPDRPALLCGDRFLSYAQLDRWTDALACRLKEMGAERGKIVGAVMSRSLAGAAAPLAIMKAGAVYFPLDPLWPTGRIGKLLAFTHASVLITDRALDLESPVPTLLVEETFRHHAPAAKETPLEAPAPRDLAYVICTSGTTGRPKATALSHQALANQVAWTSDRFGTTPDDRVLHTLAFTFDPSLWLLFPFWAVGACVNIAPLEMNMDSGALMAHLHQRGISRLALPARVGGRLFDHARRAASGDADIRNQFPASLRTLLLGGEVPKGLASVDFEVVNAYGPTEACIQAAVHTIAEGTGTTRVIGSPIANMRAYVLDRSRRPCPVGVEGELCLSGPQLARAYLFMPEETAAAFVPNPFSEEPGYDRIYRTGDRARWRPDGNLEFMGRNDSQVKIRGHRVELAEVQQALRRAPGVADAHILARDDHAAGKRLDAYFIPAGEASPPDRMRAFLLNHLPEYMVPATFTPLASWPLNRNGKLDPAALPVPSLQPKTGAPPETPAEKVLARAWEAVLGISGISRDDSFFDLGGHSLLLLNVIGHIGGTYALDLRDFFKTPVLRELAATMKPRGEEPVVSSFQTRQIPAEADRGYQALVASAERLALTHPPRIRRLMLTGATGYLGAFLLREYHHHCDAHIVLPIRGAADPRKRLLDNLSFYFGRPLAAAITNDPRITIIPANLSRPGDMDLLKKHAGPLDLILHSAAAISHYGSPERLRSANVTATQGLLSLADAFDKCTFAHISTLTVVNRPRFSEIDADLGPPALNLYSRTKQEAEALVFAAMDRGRPCMIFRAGNLILDTENRKSPRGAERNMFLRLARMMATTGLAPDTSGEIGYTFVDQAARAIRLLAGRACLRNRVFHIDNPHRMPLPQVLSMSLPENRPIRLLPAADLKTKLSVLGETDPGRKGSAAREYLAWIRQQEMEAAEGEILPAAVKMDWTLSVLARLNFSWPKITPALAGAILDRALTLPEPSAAPPFRGIQEAG